MDNAVIKTRHREWVSWSNVHSWGSVFDHKGNSLDVKQINSQLNKLNSHVEIKKYLASLVGNFALIIETKTYIYCVTDFIASQALFYSVKHSVFYVSDDIHEIISTCGCSVNKNLFEELYTMGYILGEETICSGIKRIGANTFTIYDKANARIATEKVYPIENRIKYDYEEDVLFKHLEVIFDDVFQKLADSVKGKHVVIPLSGGFDSRLIACQLKKYGVENITCYTYGSRDDHEVKAARMVADKLELNWHFIEYNREKWEEFLSDSLTSKYLKFAGQLNTIPHIQDYIAVKHLIDRSLIPRESVFVPGHSGDMLTGSKIPVELVEADYRPVSQKRFTRLLLRQNCNVGYVSSRTKEHLQKVLFVGKSPLPEEHDEDKIIRAFDIWNFYERQQKYIINSVKVFDFFGYEWRIPLWDRVLADFWFGIPSEYKKNKTLYNDFLNTRVLNQFDLAKSYKTLAKYKGAHLLMRRILRVFKDFLSAAGIIRRATFFIPFEREVRSKHGLYKKKLFKDRFFMASFTLYYSRVISRL